MRVENLSPQFVKGVKFKSFLISEVSSYDMSLEKVSTTSQAIIEAHPR